MPSLQNGEDSYKVEKNTHFDFKSGLENKIICIKSMWCRIFPFHEREAELYQPLVFLQLKNNKWIMQRISWYNYCILKFSVLLDFFSFFQLNLYFLFIYCFQWQNKQERWETQKTLEMCMLLWFVQKILLAWIPGNIELKPMK